MDPFAVNPASPLPVPTTATVDLQLQPHQPIPMPDLSLPPVSDVMKEADATLNEQTAASAGHSSIRKRGRPRKLKPTTEPNFQQPVVEPPAKEVNGAPLGEAVSEVVPEKRVARPVERFGADMVRRDVVKKKISNKSVLSGPLGYPKRGRGRPPKSRSVTDIFNGPVKTLAVAGMSRRGRPKRSVPNKPAAVVPKAIGLGSKKGGSQVLGPVEPQWMVDYAHVRAKIDHVQSRMREAIGVIKPHLTSQIVTNGHFGTALQELDQISTMDVLAVSLGCPVEEPLALAETQVH